MTFQDLGERDCFDCKETINLCLEVADYETAIPNDYAKIKYHCPHCKKEVEDRVTSIWDNLSSIPKDYVKATLV